MAAEEIQLIDLPYTASLADLLRAGISAQGSSGQDEATRHLEAASSGFHGRKMYVYEAVARRRLAQLRGERSAEFLPGQHIANPDAVTRMLAPGFPMA